MMKPNNFTKHINSYAFRKCICIPRSLKETHAKESVDLANDTLAICRVERKSKKYCKFNIFLCRFIVIIFLLVLEF